MRLQRVRDGAHKVLTECLGLRRHEVLSLFLDETTREVAEVLAEVATEHHIEVRQQNVPLHDQAKFALRPILPERHRQLLEEARGILTCLSHSADGTEYRRALIQHGTNDGKVFGHMPGVTKAVLANAVNINYKMALGRCDDLAVAMRAGKRGLLRTYVFDDGGQPLAEYDLELDLGGFRRSPITSTGIIPPGTWGNLPGGETFIAPVERCAEGAFVLNGAFTDCVLEAPDHILLRFDHGEWTDIECANDKIRNAFIALLETGRGAGQHRRVLAELGVGVNPGIGALTGIALFDEKCEGTAHIALGDNTGYGGENESDFHEDLITRNPSLWIDGMPILYCGRDVFDARQWRESGVPIGAAAPWNQFNPRIWRAGTGGFVDDGGRLWAAIHVTPGRVCSYSVGLPETSQLLGRIFPLIPEPPDSILFSHLCERLRNVPSANTDIQMRAMIDILRRHEMIEFP